MVQRNTCLCGQPGALYMVMALVGVCVVLVAWGTWSAVQHEGMEGASVEKSVIPKRIFQTWKTHDLPPKMRACVDALKRAHPDFEHQLMDDTECLAFLRKYFDQEVVDAYRALKPGAYKADLWRYCVLYIHGGIYLDIKYQCCDGFNLSAWVDAPHLCKDVRYERIVQGIYNACLVCPAGDPLMQRCISRVVDNVQARYYGSTQWDITGPTMMAQLLTDDDRKVCDLQHVFEAGGGGYIAYLGKRAIEMYPGYRDELVAMHDQDKTPRYYELWERREVYHKASGGSSSPDE